MRDKRENEYNRTNVQDRRIADNRVEKKDGFTRNVNKSPRVFETKGAAKRQNYLNEQLRGNITRVMGLS
jgi:hypothetical protein